MTTPVDTPIPKESSTEFTPGEELEVLSTCRERENSLPPGQVLK